MRSESFPDPGCRAAEASLHHEEEWVEGRERWMEEEDQRDTVGGGGQPKTAWNPEPGNFLFVLSHYCRSWQ